MNRKICAGGHSGMMLDCYMHDQIFFKRTLSFPAICKIVPLTSFPQAFGVKKNKNKKQKQNKTKQQTNKQKTFSKFLIKIEPQRFFSLSNVPISVKVANMNRTAKKYTLCYKSPRGVMWTFNQDLIQALYSF